MTAGEPQPAQALAHVSPPLIPSLPRKNSRLQFNKVKVEDAGEYVCEAENILGKDTVRGRLHVNSGRCSPTKGTGPAGVWWGRPVAPQPSGGPHMICLALDSPPSRRCRIKPQDLGRFREMQSKHKCLALLSGPGRAASSHFKYPEN